MSTAGDPASYFIGNLFCRYVIFLKARDSRVHKRRAVFEVKVEISKDETGPHFIILTDKKPIHVRVNFIERRKIGLKSDLLARAIGYKNRVGKPGEIRKLKILDATAGLCRDSFHMAALGCEVIALEENRQIFEVVSHHVNLLPDKYDLTLVHAEAKRHLTSLREGQFPDVIYLDPMFPEKNKSAKSGKEAELLKLLAPISSAFDEEALLNLAVKAALKRVVVKRPLSAPPIKAKPSIVFTGKTVRYDVYVSDRTVS